MKPQKPYLTLPRCHLVIRTCELIIQPEKLDKKSGEPFNKKAFKSTRDNRGRELGQIHAHTIHTINRYLHTINTNIYTHTWQRRNYLNPSRERIIDVVRFDLFIEVASQAFQHPQITIGRKQPSTKPLNRTCPAVQVLGTLLIVIEQSNI